MANELTLWVDAFWISPYAFSSFVALEEKKLAYDVEEIAMHRAEYRAPDYAKHSLTARVPMLRHRDFYLSESSAIAEYLEEAFPGTPRLLPEDVQQRARARQVMAWVRSDLMPIREERSAETIFYAPSTVPLSPKAAASRGQAARSGGRAPLARGDLALREVQHRRRRPHADAPAAGEERPPARGQGAALRRRGLVAAERAEVGGPEAADVRALLGPPGG